MPCTSAHIGGTRAAWSSWSGGAVYAALAGALGGALQVLAPHCSLLRAALALSDEDTDNTPEDTDLQESYRKNKKLQRVSANVNCNL